MADEPVEAKILDDIEDLHRAMYARMSTISGVTGIHFLGFDSSRQKNPLPTVAAMINLAEISVDRKRPTPSDGNRVEENSGVELIKTYPYSGTYTGHESRKYRYPLPVELIYEIDTWCHSAQEQLQIDQELLRIFPERGAITITIDDEDFDFPIELIGVQPLDDLVKNLRERVYRYRVEAYITGNIPDVTRKVILTSEIDVFPGSVEEDINMPAGGTPMDSLIDTPEDE